MLDHASETDTNGSGVAVKTGAEQPASVTSSSIYLSITSPPNGMMFPGVEDSQTITVSGTASATSPVALQSVSWSVDGGPATAISDPGNGWGTWTISIMVPSGTHVASIAAIDTTQHYIQTDFITIHVSADFDVDQDSYLRALVDFATAVDSSGNSLVVTGSSVGQANLTLDLIDGTFLINDAFQGQLSPRERATGQIGNYASLHSRPGYLQIERQVGEEQAGQLMKEITHELGYYYTSKLWTAEGGTNIPEIEPDYRYQLLHANQGIAF
jgi:hypothetical protein